MKAMKRLVLIFCFLTVVFNLNCLSACDYTTSDNVVITPGGNHNAAIDYTQIYVLADVNGDIVATSNNGDFGTQDFGSYSAYALNYENANPPTTLPVIGINIVDINDGCSLFSAALAITVCNTSVLTTCEDSGDDIIISLNPDYNADANYNQYVVVVDDASGLIEYVSLPNASTGSINYTTTAITGDLTNGNYTAYLVNFENAESLAGLGLIVGNAWTGNFGAACALASAGAAILVDDCSSCSSDAGNTIASTSDASNNDFVLCWNESLTLFNNNFVLPGAGPDEGFAYAVYSSPMPGVIPNPADGDFIEYLIGSGNNANYTLTNDGSYTPPFINNPTQTIYLYPVTLDDTLTPAIDQDGDVCYAVGNQISVTFLNEINLTSTQDCLSQSGIFTVTGGYPEFFTGDYNFTGTGSGALSSATLSTSGGTVSINNLQIGDVYGLSILDDNNCSASGEPITYPSNLSYDSIVISEPTCSYLCDGTVSIYSADASQYSFNGGTYSGTFTASNFCSGSLTVSIEDNGCIIDSTFNITSPPPIDLTQSNDTTICIGSTATLFANVTGGTGALNYYWDQILGTSTTSVSPLNDTALTIYALDENSCSSDTNTINVSLFDGLSLASINFDSICEGESITLNANGQGGNGQYTYTWTNDDGSGWSQIGNPISVSPTSSSIYTIELSDNCGTPTETTDANVLVNLNPVITISADTLVGCYPLIVQFENITNGASAATCSWTVSDGQTSTECSPSMTFNTVGCYDATLTTVSNSGCSSTSTSSDLICIEEYPTASFSYTPENPNIYNTDINFINESLDNSTNEWFLDGVSFSILSDPNYVLNEIANTHEVCLEVNTNIGCSDTVCHDIVVKDVFSVYVPNAFTPDSDGKNDHFYPVISESLLDKYEFWVFDRWGEIIYYSFNTSDKWDGTYMGKNAQQDSYVWSMRYKLLGSPVYHTKQGHVSLLR